MESSRLLLASRGDARVPRRRSWSILGVVGALLLAVQFAVAVAPGLLATHDPAANVAVPLSAPSREHILGTNDIGQDLYSELIWGARVSLSIGVLAALLTTVISLGVGVTAAYFGGWLDALLMRAVDLMLVIPVLPLLLLVAVYWGAGWLKTIVLIAALAWADPARVLRAQALSVRGSDYFTAARAIGVPSRRMLHRYLLPAVLPLAVGQFALMVSRAILVEAGLSFLGLGDPTRKSWGSTLYFARASGAYMTRAWTWWVVPPGLLIALASLGFALVGYALEERLDPTLRRSGGG